MSFNESNTVEQMPDALRRFAEVGLKWSKLLSVAKF
jgi:hypothetical protein